jgi:hypothetical protein
MQPINGSLRDILAHSLDMIVEGPAIMAVEIALVLCEQVTNDGVEFSGKQARLNVWEQPAPDGAVNQWD